MNATFPNMRLPQDLAYEFIGTFARCEYALKGSNFAKGSLTSVEANWDGFARAIDLQFERITDHAFKEAVTYLLNEPPRKQFLREGKVDWKEAPANGKLPKAEQVLLMVRRVRNNLFHGAKVWSPEYQNRERDIKLVQASLIVLRQCIAINQQVQMAYDYGAF